MFCPTRSKIFDHGETLKTPIGMARVIGISGAISGSWHIYFRKRIKGISLQGNRGAPSVGE